MAYPLPAFNIQQNNQILKNPDLALNAVPRCTQAKVEKISAYIFGTLLLGGSAALIGFALSNIITPLLGLFAIPVIIVAAALIDGYRINYSNPHSLEKMKEHARNTTLTNTESLHGMKNIFEHKLLTPVEFITAFRNELNRLPFKDLIFMYSRAEKALQEMGNQDYQLPQLYEFAEAFKRSPMNFSELHRLYHLPQLAQAQIVDQRHGQMLNHLNNVCNQNSSDPTLHAYAQATASEEYARFLRESF